MLDILAFNAIKSIAIPALGGGDSGLFWSYVEHEIEMAYNTLPSGAVNLIFSHFNDFDSCNPLESSQSENPP
jgi:hypothetical protein